MGIKSLRLLPNPAIFIDFYGHIICEILDFGVPNRRNFLIFHFCRCLSTKFFESLNWNQKKTKYVWKSSRRDLFESAIFFYEKSDLNLVLRRSSWRIFGFSVLATWPSLFIVCRGMMQLHILVVIRFREKKVNSKKVSLEKWGWGWRQSDRISVVHTSRHLAAKF